MGDIRLLRLRCCRLAAEGHLLLAIKESLRRRFLSEIFRVKASGRCRRCLHACGSYSSAAREGSFGGIKTVGQNGRNAVRRSQVCEKTGKTCESSGTQTHVIVTRRTLGRSIV